MVQVRPNGICSVIYVTYIMFQLAQDPEALTVLNVA